MTAATRPLRIWICVHCRLPRSGDTNPCPKCRAAGVIEARGRWLVPDDAIHTVQAHMDSALYTPQEEAQP